VVATLRGHLTAQFCTVMTRFRACLAVIVLMLTAHVAAFLANPGTKLAERGYKFALQRHKLCRETTDIRALHIHPDALPHHLRIFLFKA